MACLTMPGFVGGVLSQQQETKPRHGPTSGWVVEEGLPWWTVGVEWAEGAAYAAYGEGGTQRLSH